MDESEEELRPWPARSVLLLVLGCLCGLAFQKLTQGSERWTWNDDPFDLGCAAFVASAGIAFAFSLERQRSVWSAAFALVVGLVVGGVTWSNGSWSSWGSNEAWQLFSALLAVIIAVPLFQTVRDAGRARLDYQALHAHSWTNAILWAAAWAFVLIVFLLALLLSQLFNLIGIHQLKDLLDKRWFDWLLAGGAFGAGIGLLRDRDRMLVMLQRVVTAILSVLTPVLAVGLVLFVLALPLTGLAPLWSETKATTPILLVCILQAFVLVNATIGNSADEEARAKVLRYAALALAIVMLPLGIVAAVSTIKRIDQYGLTPDRLWAVTFILIALACGLFYLATVAMRRRSWAEGVRRVNIRLAIGICALALFLALPIVSFGAISAGNQLWRIRTGRVAPEKADWAALRFDFGPSGQRAVERLAATSSNPRVRTLAQTILKAKDRYAANMLTGQAQAAQLPRIVHVLPQQVPVPSALLDLLFHDSGALSGDASGLCADQGSCLLKWQPGETMAIAMFDSCGPDPRYPGKKPMFGGCRVDTQVLEQTGNGWRAADELPTPNGYLNDKKQAAAARAAAQAGRVELRTIAARQVFLDGKPVGSVLMAPPPAGGGVSVSGSK
ncbi:MAG TPA: DUF4153 domain-containing protein [Allosphingosinicella sp.]|nr:DUF4153 domain-containing protein [Allosphingosinicella sp.]